MLLLRVAPQADEAGVRDERHAGRLVLRGIRHRVVTEKRQVLRFDIDKWGFRPKATAIGIEPRAEYLKNLQAALERKAGAAAPGAR